MTRFARAKGSKASNEKLPEPSTPWAEMKQELLNKNNELAEKQKREEALNRRQANYQAFLDEKEAEDNKKITWASFPEANKSNANKGKSPKKRKFSISDGGDDNKPTSPSGKKLKGDLPHFDEDDVSEDSDEQFSALKSQIDKVLAKQGRNEDDSDDDPPDEVSIKEKPQEIVVKKVKKPKRKLKIILDNEQLSKHSEDVQLKEKFKVDKKENLSEKEKKLIQKKYDRQKKQMEKKKLKKTQQTEQDDVANTSAEANTQNDSKLQNKQTEPAEQEIKNASTEVKIESKEPTGTDNFKFQKKLERRKKQKEKKKLKKLQLDKTVPVKKGENLSEDALKKIQKKTEKIARQAEKRKKFKQAQETSGNLEKINGCSKTNSGDNNESNKTDLERNKPFQNPPATPKQKKPKIRDNKEHPNRKQRPEKMFINGKTIEIDYIEGFPVKKEDAERLKKLRKEMISKGLPRSEINAALKIERRRAEKALAREKKNVCFNCRKSGHNLSECPELDKDQVAQTAGTGICFKCGSTEHTHFECKVVKGQEYKFASCFICKEQGHIARQCPDNQRGLYPKGGSCKVCGDVTHLKKDCPKYQAQQAQLQNRLCIETISSGNPDDISSKGSSTPFSVNDKKLNKVIKF